MIMFWMLRVGLCRSINLVSQDFRCKALLKPDGRILAEIKDTDVYANNLNTFQNSLWVHLQCICIGAFSSL